MDDYSRAARCATCKLPPVLCICAGLPTISLPVRIVIIQRPRERNSQSNTGWLVERVFANGEVHDYPDVLVEPGRSQLWGSDLDYRVLFPLPDSEQVSPQTFSASVTSGRKPALVVLDANWRQSRRMSRRLPGLRSFPFVTVPNSPPARVMRRPVRPGQLSTGEAVARAVDLLGYPAEARQFASILTDLTARVLHVRGQGTRASFRPTSAT